MMHIHMYIYTAHLRRNCTSETNKNGGPGDGGRILSFVCDISHRRTSYPITYLLFAKIKYIIARHAGMMRIYYIYVRVFAHVACKIYLPVVTCNVSCSEEFIRDDDSPVHRVQNYLCRLSYICII